MLQKWVIVLLILVGCNSERIDIIESESIVETITNENITLHAEVIASDLRIPWDIGFLPSGDMLITERGGRLLRRGSVNVSIPVQSVRHIGEGGLLGLELHPDYSSNGWIYLYFTSFGKGLFENRVERFVFDETNNELLDRTVIIEDIPGAVFHDGGRMRFGPDGYLYITTGDATDAYISQDLESIGGKLLRLTDSGEPAPGNPYGDFIYSYGHRNSQGIDWDSTGQLWSSEHGRSGDLSGYDELNLIEIGKNYGWPVIEGSESRDNMIAPIVHSGPDYTWAPGGLAILEDIIFIPGLKGETLYSYCDGCTLQRHFEGEFGRLRTAVVYEGSLYITTSNRDGRGEYVAGDDRILKITLNS